SRRRGAGDAAGDGRALWTVDGPAPPRRGSLRRPDRGRRADGGDLEAPEPAGPDELVRREDLPGAAAGGEGDTSLCQPDEDRLSAAAPPRQLLRRPAASLRGRVWG